MTELEQATTHELFRELASRFDVLVLGGYKQLDQTRYTFVPLCHGDHLTLKGIIMTLMDRIRMNEGHINGFSSTPEPDEPEYGPI